MLLKKKFKGGTSHMMKEQNPTDWHIDWHTIHKQHLETM